MPKVSQKEIVGEFPSATSENKCSLFVKRMQRIQTLWYTAKLHKAYAIFRFCKFYCQILDVS